jgi:CBS domain-containing protein
VVSLSDLVKLLWEHKEALELAKTLTVEELGLVYSAVFTVSAETTALEAYHHMCMDHKSCMGVTDADGKLVGNLSLSDLRGLDQDHFGLLLLPVSEMIAILQGTKDPTGMRRIPSVTEAVAATRVKEAINGLMAERTKITVKSTSTFEELLDLVVTNRVQRAYVVDADYKPISIITLTDILRLVIKE